MGKWLGATPVSGRLRETVVIEIKSDWIDDVINLIGEENTELYLNSLYAGNEIFENEVVGSDQGLYEQFLEREINNPVAFEKLKNFMEKNHPLIWRGHDTFIGNPNTEFNEFMFKYSETNIWLPLTKKFDGRKKDLVAGKFFIDKDGTISGHSNYDFGVFEHGEWENWYVPKGLYEIMYLWELPIVPQAINFRELKL